MATHSRPDRVGHLVQQKLAQLGRTDDKLDHEVKTLETQVAEWAAQDEQNRPKAKRAAALNVMRTVQEYEKAGIAGREVGATLGLRVVPDLHFAYDEAIDRGDRIERLLREVHEEDARRQEDAPQGPEDE